MKKFKINKKTVAAGAVVMTVLGFLLLPAFFAEQTASLMLAQDSGIAGSLPVITSKNPLSKYLSQAKNFYGLGAEKTAFGRSRGVLPPAPDEVYTDEQRAEVFASYAKTRIAAGAVKDDEGSVITKEDVIVQPDERGYYYGNTYYKNGTYPGPALKESIESSIARFHEAQAAKEGARAAYVLQNDGSLIVKYMPQAELDELAFAAQRHPKYSNGNFYETFYSSAKNYDGARVLSKNESGRGDASSAPGSSGDIGGLYAAAGRGFAEMQTDMGFTPNTQTKTDERRKEEARRERQRDKDIVLNVLGDFNERMFRGWRRNRANIDPIEYDKEKFSDARTIVSNKLKEEFSLKTDDFKNQGVVFEYLHGFHRENIIGTYEQSENPSKIFGAKGDNNIQILRHIRGHDHDHDHDHEKEERTGTRMVFQNWGKPTKSKVFFNFVSIPAYNPEDRKDDIYTKIYFENTGLKSVLTQMELKEDKVAEIRGYYEKLDARRKEIRKNNKDFIRQNPVLQNLRPETYYILGREGDNIVVATDKSHLYATTPNMLPQGETYRGGQEDSGYKSTTIDNLLDDFARDRDKKLVLPIIAKPGARGEQTEIGGQKAILIDPDILLAYSPKGLEEKQEITARGYFDVLKARVGREKAEQVKQALDKAKEERKKQAIANAREMEEKAKKISSNPGENAKKGTTVNRPPLRNTQDGSTQPEYKPFIPMLFDNGFKPYNGPLKPDNNPPKQ
jgi:hypothetical protein